MKKNLKNLVVFIFIFSFVSFYLKADDYSWKGGTSSDWSDESNWKNKTDNRNGGYPDDPSDSAKISDETFDPVLSENITIGSLEAKSGSSLTLGTFSLTVQSGSIDLNSNVSVSGTGSLNVVGSSVVINSSTISCPIDFTSDFFDIQGAIFEESVSSGIFVNTSLEDASETSVIKGNTFQNVATLQFSNTASGSISFASNLFEGDAGDSVTFTNGNDVGSILIGETNSEDLFEVTSHFINNGISNDNGSGKIRFDKGLQTFESPVNFQNSGAGGIRVKVNCTQIYNDTVNFTAANGFYDVNGNLSFNSGVSFACTGTEFSFGESSTINATSADFNVTANNIVFGGEISEHTFSSDVNFTFQNPDGEFDTIDFGSSTNFNFGGNVVFNVQGKQVGFGESSVFNFGGDATFNIFDIQEEEIIFGSNINFNFNKNSDTQSLTNNSDFVFPAIAKSNDGTLVLSSTTVLNSEGLEVNGGTTLLETNVSFGESGVRIGAAGTLDVNQANHHTIEIVSGSWSNNGIFQAREGLVHFKTDDLKANLNGTTSFYDFQHTPFGDALSSGVNVVDLPNEADVSVQNDFIFDGGDLDFNGLTISVASDVTISSTTTFTDPGGLDFIGSGDQTFNTGELIYSNVTHSGSGKVEVNATNFSVDTSFSNDSGIFDFNGSNFNFTGNTFSNDGTLRFVGSEEVVLNGGGDNGSGTTEFYGIDEYTVDSDFTNFYHLTFGQGSYSFAAEGSKVTIGGNLTNNGTLSTAVDFDFLGDTWDNLGSFIASDPSTVEFIANGGSRTHVINGDNEFFNFTVNNTSESGDPDQTLRFQAGSTTTVTNLFSIAGRADVQRVNLHSETDSEWFLNVASASVDFAEVAYSNASGSANPIEASNSKNIDGTNVNWTFLFVSNVDVVNKEVEVVTEFSFALQPNTDVIDGRTFDIAFPEDVIFNANGQNTTVLNPLIDGNPVQDGTSLSIDNITGQTMTLLWAGETVPVGSEITFTLNHLQNQHYVTTYRIAIDVKDGVNLVEASRTPEVTLSPINRDGDLDVNFSTFIENENGVLDFIFTTNGANGFSIQFPPEFDIRNVFLFSLDGKLVISSENFEFAGDVIYVTFPEGFVGDTYSIRVTNVINPGRDYAGGDIVFQTFHTIGESRRAYEKAVYTVGSDVFQAPDFSQLDGTFSNTLRNSDAATLTVSFETDGIPANGKIVISDNGAAYSFDGASVSFEGGESSENTGDDIEYVFENELIAGTYQLEVSGFAHPEGDFSVGGSENDANSFTFYIQTQDAEGDDLEKGNFSHRINLSNVALADQETSQLTSADIQLALGDDENLPADGKVCVIFPEGFNVNGASDPTSEEVDGGLTIEFVNGQRGICIVRDGTGDPVSGGSIVSFNVSGIATPATSGSTQFYTVSTTNADNSAIEFDDKVPPSIIRGRADVTFVGESEDGLTITEEGPGFVVADATVVYTDPEGNLPTRFVAIFDRDSDGTEERSEIVRMNVVLEDGQTEEDLDSTQGITFVVEDLRFTYFGDGESDQVVNFRYEFKNQAHFLADVNGQSDFVGNLTVLSPEQSSIPAINDPTVDDDFQFENFSNGSFNLTKETGGDQGGESGDVFRFAVKYSDPNGFEPTTMARFCVDVDRNGQYEDDEFFDAEELLTVADGVIYSVDVVLSTQETGPIGYFAEFANEQSFAQGTPNTERFTGDITSAPDRDNDGRSDAEEGNGDVDGDGILDFEDVNTATFSTLADSLSLIADDQVILEQVSFLPQNDDDLINRLDFPSNVTNWVNRGFISFRAIVPEGSTQTFQMIIPNTVGVLYKFDEDNGWFPVDFDNVSFNDDGTRTISYEVIDNGPGDSNPQLGIIDDPAGFGSLFSGGDGGSGADQLFRSSDGGFCLISHSNQSQSESYLWIVLATLAFFIMLIIGRQTEFFNKK